MNKTTVFGLFAVVFAAALFGAFWWMWSIREEPQVLKDRKRAVVKEFRKLPADEVTPYLKRMSEKTLFTVRPEGEDAGIGFKLYVPIDFIAQLSEDGFFRFAGDAKSPKADTDRRLKDLLAFTGGLLARGDVTAEAKASLEERRLDGFFLTGDYDGAVAVLEKGIKKRSPAWCKGTIAKLRAHKALEAGNTPENRREAVKQFLIFGEFMLSDEMKDFEDADPATGIVYSREWVAARNYMRCSTYSAEAGDADLAAKYKALAKPLFQKAAEKAKDDKLSADELAKEMKSAGL